MKKLILFVAAIAMVGCSEDDPSNSSNTSFKFDGTQYEMPPALGMGEIIMSDVTTFNGDSYDRSTISVTGMNGTTATATVAFDLYYKAGTSVEGTYEIYDTEADDTGDFEEFLVGKTRGCMGWTSAGMIFTMSGGSMVSGNNPAGTVKVVKNSATNYTLTYNGDFRLYENGFDFVRNMPTQISVTSDVTIQE